MLKPEPMEVTKLTQFSDPYRTIIVEPAHAPVPDAEPPERVPAPPEEEPAREPAKEPVKSSVSA